MTTGQTTILNVEGLHKSFTVGDDTLPVVERIAFAQSVGEFLSIVGPSGCGKSTLLRLLSGLIAPDAGHVRHHGKEVKEPPEWMSVVFQDYRRSLFPWLTVTDNVRLGAERAGRDPSGPPVSVAVTEALDAVGLSGFGTYFPWQLSGGMQQRVALARAVAARPTLLLLDEPFASVDAQTRMVLQDLVLSLWHQLEIAVLLVTHDIEEALFLSDRVLVLGPRPTTVAHVMDVDLPRPRDQVTTKAEPRFAELRGELYGHIKASTQA